MKCNCPMCAKTEMKQGEAYRCKIDNAVMGVCDLKTLMPPLSVAVKVLNDDYDNEKNDPTTIQ